MINLRRFKGGKAKREQQLDRAESLYAPLVKLFGSPTGKSFVEWIHSKRQSYIEKKDSANYEDTQKLLAQIEVCDDILNHITVASQAIDAIKDKKKELERY